MFRKALTALALTLALAAGSAVSASASPIDNVPPILATFYAWVTQQSVTQEDGGGHYNRDVDQLDGSVFDDGVGSPTGGPVKGDEDSVLSTRR